MLSKLKNEKEKLKQRLYLTVLMVEIAAILSVHYVLGFQLTTLCLIPKPDRIDTSLHEVI